MAGALEALIAALNENVGQLNLSIKQLAGLMDEPAKGIGVPRTLSWQLRRFLSLAQFNYASSVVVGTTPTPIAGQNQWRIELLIYNNGSSTVYVGGANVTTLAGDSRAGVPILATTGLVFDRTAGALWGVVASGTTDLRVLEQSATELAHQDTTQ